MQQKQQRLLIGGGIGVAVLIVALVTLPLGFTAFPKKITLTYVGGLVCADPDPATPEIKDSGSVRRRAKWKVAKDQRGDYYWKIEYQAASANAPLKAGTGNYLGPVDPIDCSKNTTLSKLAPADTANKQWPYKITVYECVDVDKNDKSKGKKKGPELCVRDPIIWIKD